MIEKFEEGTSDTDFTKVGEKTYKYQVSYFYESKKGATKGFLCRFLGPSSIATTI